MNKSLTGIDTTKCIVVCFNSQNFYSFFQELQRRLDQTLGKPGNYHHGIDKEGHIKPMTIGGRLYRLENQVCRYTLLRKNTFYFTLSQTFWNTVYIGVSFFTFFLVQMSHQDKKLDHMTEMLQNVIELQRLQLQQSENQSQGALTNED